MAEMNSTISIITFKGKQIKQSNQKAEIVRLKKKKKKHDPKNTLSM